MPSTPGSGLKVLIEEARHRHEDTRPDMLRALVRLYLREPQHSPVEQVRFATLARRLIEAVEVPVAAKWVREIASRADLPREFVLHLARGPLAVAGPVLRLSPVLTEEDLVAVARSTSRDHFAAVSARRDVSPALAKQLAELLHRAGEAGAAPPETTPLAPADAPPSPAEPALAKVAHALAAMTALSDGTAAPVLTEPDAPAAPAPAVGTAVEPAAESTAAAPPPAPMIDKPAATPADGPTSPAMPDYLAAGPDERAAIVARLVTLPPLPLAERPPAATEGFTDALIEAARGGEAAEIAALIEQALAITPENAAHVVADATGQAFAVAARALGLSFAVLSRVLFRLHPATGRSAAEMTRLAETFDMLPVASAQHLVASWRATGRRLPRERAEDAPSMRSYGQPRPVPHGAAEPVEGRQQS